MALDGAFLSLIKKEILNRATNSRIDKIHQPSKEELVVVLRFPGGTEKLLISAGANSPRIHFTKHAPENPKTPPMFCMLLRKYLGSGRLKDVRQLELDRVLFLDFETVNEFRDSVCLTLAVEIMGRHSNIILIGEDGKIIDSIKRIDQKMSGVRMVLPGITYREPPMQNKLNMMRADNQVIFEKMRNIQKRELSDAMMKSIQGISPIYAREAAFYTTKEQDISMQELDKDMLDRLSFFLNRTREILNSGKGNFTTVIENGKPKDFSFIHIGQYGSFLQVKQFDSASLLLDHFFSERDMQERMKQRSTDILKMLVNTSERISRKLATQKQELEESTHRDVFKMYGDLLNSNLYKFQKGDKTVTLVNYYDENEAEVTIPLDVRMTPTQNAQRYYSEYKKAATAEKKLTELTVKTQEELEYIDSVFDALTRAITEDELFEIRQELAEQGYLKHNRNRYKQVKQQKPLRYISSDGYTILCGRNNKQNDLLTLKEARNYDLWLHTQKIPGSHVIVVSQGEPIPNTTIEEAAVIAAYNSKARDSAQVAVDYTLIKYVKKPKGAKPGMVIFEQYQTAYVTPDKDFTEKLLST